MGLLRKKKDPAEVIQNLIKRLEDVRFNLSMHKRRLEAKIKRYLKRGKMPPGPLLIGWKTSDVLLSTVESSVISLQTATMMTDIGNAIKDAVGSKSLAKAGDVLRQLTQSLSDIKLSLHQMVRVQSQMVNIAQGMNQNIESMLNEVMGTAEEVMPEVVESIGAEVLDEIKSSDPTLYETLPEELKRKFSSTEEG
jgi:hypothetical protein